MTERYTNDRNFNLLIDKFNDISKKGYIRSINNNNNSNGLTFEKEIGKKVDSMYRPDFKDIEIKCKQKGSRFSLKLFSLSFKGPYLYENISMLKKYGKKDKDLPNKNILYTKLKYGAKVLYNNYYFELNTDYDNKRLCVNIYDINHNFIEKRGYIPLSILQKRVNLKLNKLALIKSYKKKENNNLYYKFYEISCYSFKGFNIFFKMIEDNIIKCCILLRYSKNEKTMGKNKSCGLMFFINECDIDKIFEKIYFDKR